MGLDEALLDSEGAPPTVRMYTWSPDTLSLGYFQRCADVPALAQPPVSMGPRATPGTPRAPGAPGAVVRRITGGGAIHHTGELTFSITAPLSHPLYQGTVADSYRRIHASIAAALREYGVEAELRGSRALASDRPGTGMCFHRSTELDLAWDGRKGVGSAQRRKGKRVLHHGSIKLSSSPLEGDIAFVDRAGTDLSAPGFAATLRSALERSLGIRLEAAVPDPVEREAARALGGRYVDPDFVRRR